MRPIILCPPSLLNALYLNLFNLLSTFFFILFFLFYPLALQAQTFMGYHATSYAGVYGTLYNPANILDHRVSSDINLVGFSFEGQNNIALFALNASKVIQVPNPITKSGISNFQTDVLGPSFMKRLSDKHAFAITTRARVQTNMDNLSPDLLNLSLQDKENIPHVESISIPKAVIKTHAWNELAFTYSRQIANSDFGVWKAAISLKVLGGQGAVTLKTDNLSFIYHDSVSYNSNTNYINSGATETQGNLNWKYANFLDNYGNYTFFRQPGFAVDAGFTYEYRDELQVYDTKYNEQTLNYRWKAGASITDAGSILYKSSSTSYNAHFSGQSYVFNDFNIPSDSNTITSIANFYSSKLPGSHPAVSNFRMWLPTTIHLMFDYSFNRWLSAEAHLSMPVLLTDKYNYEGTYNPTILSVTPRAELPWAGLYMPINYNFLSGLQMGAAIRLGPIVLGSASLVNVGGLQKTKGADAYFILRIPFFKYKPYESEDVMDHKHYTRKQWKTFNCPTF